MPALKERKGDVRLLLDFFLEQANIQHPMPHPCQFMPDVYQLLEQYPWPGNVRELQNLVERMVVLSGGGPVTLETLPTEYRYFTGAGATHKDIVRFSEIRSEVFSESKAEPSLETLPAEGIDLEGLIERLENSLIMQALERTGHNKNQAAKLLGLNRTTLVERIKKRRLAPLNAPSKEL